MLPVYQKLLDVDRKKNAYYITVKSTLSPKKKLVQEIIRVEHLGKIEPDRNYFSQCDGYWGRLMYYLAECEWLRAFMATQLKNEVRLYPVFPKGVTHEHITELNYMTYVWRVE